MQKHLSENDLKICFCLLNKYIGEKTVNQYRFDDKFSQKISQILAGNKDEKAQDSTQKTQDDSLLFIAKKDTCNNACNVHIEKSQNDDFSSAIFDYKNLFGC